MCIRDRFSVALVQFHQKRIIFSFQVFTSTFIGLIGRHLIPRLLELGHSVTVSTRHPDTARARLDPRVTLWRDFEGHHHLNDIDAVINLAGEPIADKRWTAEQKQRLCHSRWDLTQRLVGLFHASDTPPSVLISGSATGYYGDLGDCLLYTSYVQLLVFYSGMYTLEIVKGTELLNAFFRSGLNCTVLALTLNTCAYTTEIFAGAIRSVPAGEIEAARAYGFSSRCV